MTWLERRALQRALSRLPGLDRCPAAQLRLLARTGTAVTVPTQWSLIQEGTPADRAFLILSGRAVVSVRGQLVAVLGPGTLFGERALLERRLRAATVTSTEPMRVLTLGYLEFQRLLEHQPRLARLLLEGSQRLERAG